MKKVLASIGIGNATVDTVLASSTVQPGQSVDAEIHIEGGSAEQSVDAVELDVETQCATDDGYTEVSVGRLRLSDDFTVEPGESDVRTATIDIPYATPVTLGRVQVWVETELDIAMAVDPDDRDHLEVDPTPRMQAVFDAMDDLGFSFRAAECQVDRAGRYASGQSFVQEFEFHAAGGPFGGRVDEVELVFLPAADALTVFVEVDRRAGLLTELADADERTTSVSVDSTDAAVVRDQLRTTIERFA
ncbi:sporulation protein [Salinigranum halophilum]|jgi:sporulation-control protein|uniref:sporulation protein n=1 Tax=Salinigranum halophilum TaxID=2565931 RepID=UPI00115D4596|nr:sporulation protein [Salinigranum halophilum]